MCRRYLSQSQSGSIRRITEISQEISCFVQTQKFGGAARQGMNCKLQSLKDCNLQVNLGGRGAAASELGKAASRSRGTNDHLVRQVGLISHMKGMGAAPGSAQRRQEVELLIAREDFVAACNAGKMGDAFGYKW